MLTAYLQLKQNGTLKTPALARVDLKPNGSPSDLTVFHTELRMYWMLTRSILYRSGKNHWQLLKERKRGERCKSIKKLEWFLAFIHSRMNSPLP